MTRPAIWIAGAFAAIVVASLAAVYALGVFVPEWGAGKSLQIFILLGFGLSLLGCVGYVVASIHRRSVPTKLRALVSGAVFAFALYGALMIVERVAPGIHSLWVSVLIAPILGSLSSLLVQRSGQKSL